MAEEDIVDRLISLTEIQLEMVVYRSEFPKSYLPGTGAANASIAIAIAEQCRAQPEWGKKVSSALGTVLGMKSGTQTSTGVTSQLQAPEQQQYPSQSSRKPDNEPLRSTISPTSQRRKSLDEGRYKLKGTLGKGASATVYEAFDNNTEERVAVKVLSLNCHDPVIARAMFDREVGALDGLNHPNIVPMLRHVTDEERQELLIVLRRVPGGQSLQTLIHQGLPVGKFKRMRWRIEQLLALLSGLEAAHRKHIIHRDLKLGNILFDNETEQLMLVDFGIARILENYAMGNRGETLKAFFTRPYASPEQALAQDTSFAADMYAFGVVAASLLTWAIPPDSLNRKTLPQFLASLSDSIPNKQALNPLREVLFQLLAEEARSRPNIAKMQLALRQVLETLEDREPTHIIITHKARQQASELMSDGIETAIEDLNASPRVEYQPEEEDPNRYAILVLGRTLQAVLRPDNNSGSSLVLVSLFKPYPSKHNRMRERATGCPFLFEEGRCSGEALIELAYADYLRRSKEREARKNREDALHIAKLILEKQRERMKSLEVRYSLDQPAHEEAGWKTQLAALSQSPDERKPSRAKQHQTTGEYLTLHVMGVRVAAIIGDDEEVETEFAEALSEEWVNSLSQDSVFLHKGKQFATAHGYDPANKILKLKLKRKVGLPFNGVIQCHDVALETSLDRQEKALAAYLDDAAVNAQLGQLIVKPENNTIGEKPLIELIQNLSPPEFIEDMISRALAAKDIFMVQGPPGTGKTTLISEFMAQLLLKEPGAKILLTSQANEAVNNAVEGVLTLAEQNKARWRIVRDASQRAKAADPEIGFDRAFHRWSQRTIALSQKAIQAYSNGPLTEVAKAALANWREKLPNVRDVQFDYAESVQIFGMTCLRVPTLWKLLPTVEFDWVIIDEAARATPAELLVALVTGKKFVLVGDHRQLPPFLDTESERDLRNSDIDPELARRSLFETLFERIPPENREALRVQFRMHSSIGKLVGSLYYDDIGLKTGVPDSERDLGLEGFGGEERVFWIDVNKGQEQSTSGDTSRWNHAEVVAIEHQLKRFEQECREKDLSYTVGVIAAYRRQASKIQERLRPKSLKQWKKLKIRVNTVDAFQGKQDDIILYSMVRTHTSRLGFISDRRRLNVAFSRARRLLMIFGHKETVSRSPEIRKILAAIPPANIITEGAKNEPK